MTVVPWAGGRPSPPRHLPRALTSFVGRTRALAALGRLLEGTPLLTITGTGGTGKSRLALRVAEAVQSRCPDGVWLADLAPLSDPGLVPQAVAVALGVTGQPGRPLPELLLDVLAPRRLLLVLDNCEHLAESCAALVEALLPACPGVRVLATSREALRVAGEVVWPAPPLETPPPGEAAPDVLAGCEAVALFVERARAVRPDFALTPANTPAVAELCRRLDGLPLALELAAARVRVLPVEELLARLEDRLRLLSGGSRRALPRHQTLAATIDWSFALLSEPERALFARLSVFAGGWSLAAAEAVAADGAACGAGGEGALGPAGDVLERLTRLVDRSLVIAGEDGEGHARFRLLETLRAYARERLLAGGDAAAVHRRHLAYHAVLAQTAAALLERDQVRWLNHLEREHDNCRAALRWALEHPGGGAAELALRLAGALVEFWRMRGHHQEGHDWLEGLLAVSSPAPPSAPQAGALLGAGSLARYFSDRKHARARLEAGLAMARALGHRRLTRRGLVGLAAELRNGDDEPGARALLEECVALSRKVGDRMGMSTALMLLGWGARVAGDYATARRELEESLALVRQDGRLEPDASILNQLAYVLRVEGDLPGARANHEVALADWRASGYTQGIALALSALADVSSAMGDMGAARGYYEEGLVSFRQPGGDQIPGHILGHLALAACALGETGAAAAHLRRAVASWQEIGRRQQVANLLEAFAALAASRGQPRRALRLDGAAAALRRVAGRPRHPLHQEYLDRWLEPARRSLDRATIEAAESVGRTMTLDESMNEAVDWTPSPDGGAPAGQLGTPAQSGLASRPPGRLRVDARTFEVWRGDAPLPRPLSPQEFTLVAYLYSNRGRVCTRRELGDAIWGAHGWDTSMLHNLVRRTKAKLDVTPAGPPLLLSVRGIGYRLTP